MLGNKNVLFGNINVKNVVKFFYTDVKSIVDKLPVEKEQVIEILQKVFQK